MVMGIVKKEKARMLCRFNIHIYSNSKLKESNRRPETDCSRQQNLKIEEGKCKKGNDRQ